MTFTYKGFTIKTGFLLGDTDSPVYFVYNAKGQQMFDYHESEREAEQAIDDYLWN